MMLESQKVLPLVIPNNFNYNEKTKKLEEQNEERNCLKVCKKALEFIKKLPKDKKIGVITICGKARTGKSLIAGELMEPNVIPCAFDIGHSMDACTRGIWVGTKPVTIPDRPDEIFLILDVEGTSYRKGNLKNDMQLMILVLLISSLLIYNSKGIFDGNAEDEIQLMGELNKLLSSDAESKKFLYPVFVWLLRDAHLTCIIDDREVTCKEYFEKQILNRNTQKENDVTINNLFRDYDVFKLPIPCFVKRSSELKKLGSVPKTQFGEEFSSEIDKFVSLIMKKVKPKILADCECDSLSLAIWIEKSVEMVNNEVKGFSSAADETMKNCVSTRTENAIKECEQCVREEIQEIKENQDNCPLQEKEIIAIFSKIALEVMQSNAKLFSNRKYQNELHKFHDATGWYSDDENKMGTTGILKQLLDENKRDSKKFCEAKLRDLSHDLEDVFTNSERYVKGDDEKKLKELKTSYERINGGPEKQSVWNEYLQNCKTKQQMFNEVQNLKDSKISVDSLKSVAKTIATGIGVGIGAGICAGVLAVLATRLL